MDYPEFIEKLYCGVLQKEMSECGVDESRVRRVNADLSEAYRVNPNWQRLNDSKRVDYNDARHRCVYLHKCAMLHTGLLCEVLPMAFQIHSVKEFADCKESLNLCSLGGGPGTDIVALLTVIREVLGLKPCHASVIDFCATGWKRTFGYIVRALADTDVGGMVDKSRFRYQYLGANLLDKRSLDNRQTREAVGNADILTMVKFVSAAACGKTGPMIEKIFRIMKPGSMLLFVDNAAGEFYEMLREKAEKCGLQPAFDPHLHYAYEESRFCRNWYGLTSQSKTKVTIVLLRKPRDMFQNQAQGGDCVDSPSDDTASSDVEESVEDDPDKDCCAIM